MAAPQHFSYALSHALQNTFSYPQKKKKKTPSKENPLLFFARSVVRAGVWCWLGGGDELR